MATSLKRRFRFRVRAFLYIVALIALLLAFAPRIYEWYYAVPTIPLADLVASFNAQYGAEPVGKYEPPVTEAEIVAAIKQQLPSLPAAPRTAAIYSSIVQSKRAPQDARLYAMSGFQLKDGTEYTVWWINLDVVTGKNSGFGLRIRENNAPVAKPKGEPKLKLPAANRLPKPP